MEFRNGWIARTWPLARFRAATPEKPEVQVDTYAVLPPLDIPSGTTSPLSDLGTVRFSAFRMPRVGFTRQSVSADADAPAEPADAPAGLADAAALCEDPAAGCPPPAPAGQGHAGEAEGQDGTRPRPPEPAVPAGMAGPPATRRNHGPR